MAVAVAVLSLVAAPALAEEEEHRLTGEQGAPPPSWMGPEDLPGASAESRQQLDAGQVEVERQEQARRKGLASPEGKAELERSKAVNRDLSDSAAVALMRKKWTKDLQPPQPDAETLIGSDQFGGFVDEVTMRIKGVNGRSDRLIQSDIPLRVRNEAGKAVPSDTDLERQGADYVPGDTATDVSLPVELRQGAEVDGIELTPAGDAAATKIENDLLVYPNAETDTDVALVPLQDGVETFHQLRSASAPERLEIALDLPEGHRLERSANGGLEVLLGEKVAAALSPPSAVDAQGRPVKVSMDREGSKAVMSVAHRGEALAYPILVDPTYEIWHEGGTGASGSWFSRNPGGIAGLNTWSETHTANVPDNRYAPRRQCFQFTVPFRYFCYSASHDGSNWDGLHMMVRPASDGGVYPATSGAQWYYVPPGYTTQIEDAWVTHVFHRPGSTAANPYFYFGIYSSATGTFLSSNSLSNGSGTSVSDFNYHQTPPSPLAPGPHLYSMGWVTHVPVSNLAQYRDGYIGGAIFTMTDPEPPQATHLAINGQGPTGWIDTASFTAEPEAKDPGLGIKYFNLRVPSVGGTQDQTRTHPCSGRRNTLAAGTVPADPLRECPSDNLVVPESDPNHHGRAWKLPDAQLTGNSDPAIAKEGRRFTFTTRDTNPDLAGDQEMAEGAQTVVVEARDIVHSTPATKNWLVKYDKSPPNADPTGTLYNARDTFVTDTTRMLTVSGQDSHSGVKSVSYKVRDGSSTGPVVRSASETNPNCDAQNGCSATFSKDFTVDLAGLDGKYFVQIEAKDQLGDDATDGARHRFPTPAAPNAKEFSFEVDRTAPQATGVSSDPIWRTDGGTATNTVSGSDSRSGVKTFRLFSPNSTEIGNFARNCGGVSPSSTPPRCLATDSHPFNYTISQAAFPGEGRVSVTGRVKDGAGNESTAATGQVRVDRSDPTIEARGGSLYAARGQVLFLDSYGLQFDAVDGSTTSAATERSGAKRAYVYVKKKVEPESAFGAPKYDSQDRPCPAGSCRFTNNWTFDTGAYEQNTLYTVRMKVVDHVGRSTSEDFDVWVLDNIGGALPLVEDRNGLEEFWNYDSTDTGASSRAHVNLDSGNLIWHSVPVVNPGRGLSTVVNVTANSQETFEEALMPENALGDSFGQYNTVGRGFSLGISGLTRVNDRLDLSKLALESKIRITDVDGTRHTFTSSDSCKTFAKPPGVHLRLRRYSPSLVEAGCTAGSLGTVIQATDPLKYWAATRPDGVTHFFDTHGYQTSIEDRNGNTIRFRYEFRSLLGGTCPATSDPDGKLAGGQSVVLPAVCPRRLTKVIDPENREMVVTYHGNRDLVPGVSVISGLVKDITDFGGRKLVFDYETGDTGYLTKLTQAHGTGDARSFGLDYEGAGTTSLLKRRALTQVTDPKGMATPSPTDGRTTFAHGSDGAPALGGLGDGLISRKRADSVSNRRSKNRSIAYQAISEGDNVRRATVTDALSHQWVHKMDSRGRARSLVDPKSTETKLEWDNSSGAPDVNGVTKLTEAAGTGDEAVTDMAYNANGQLLTQKTYPKSGETRTRTLTYRSTAGTHFATAGGVTDSPGIVTDLETITNPKPNTGWVFGLDARGNVTSRTDAATRSASTVYDPQGRVTSETDEEGNVTKYESFHPSGQPKVMLDPRGTSHEGGDAETDHRSIYKYDPVGNVTDVTDPRGAKTGGVDDIRTDFTTKLTYDSLDRLRTESIPKDTANGGSGRISTSRVYDANDNVTASTTGSRTTAINYTAMDKPDVVTAPGSEVTRYGYDDLDRLDSRTDPKGGATGAAFRTDYLLDSVGRRIAESRNAPNETPAQLVTSYAFDRRDNAIGIIDPKRNHSAGRTPQQAATAAETDANLRTKLDYNDDDELTRKTDRPNTADTTAGIRPVQTEYEYDGNGNRTAAIGSREFDSRDSAISDFKTEYEFDHRDQLISVANPADEKMVYTRRRDGKVIAQTSPRGVENGTKDSAVPGGIEPYKYFTSRFDYNANGDLTSRSVPFAPGQYGRTDDHLKGWKVSYERDAAGNPAKITDARGNQFTNAFYDTGELRSSGRPSWWKLDWGEDSPQSPQAGERFGETDGAIDTEIGMDGPSVVEAGDRSSNVTGNAAAPELPSSESAGNFGEVDPQQLPGLVPSAGQTTFAYDNEMRLTTVSDADGKQRTLTYEPSGRVDTKVWPFKPGESIEHEFDYDPNGNLTQFTNGRNDTTTLTYDGYDRRSSESAPGSCQQPEANEDPCSVNPETTNYAYDANGNLSERETPLGATRKFRFGYDSLDRLNVETNPAAESWSYAHNTAGMPVVERSPRGQTDPVAPPSPAPAATGTSYDTKRAYDPAERLSEVVDGFGEDTDFEYDADGNRTKVTAPGAGTEPNASDVDRVTETSYDGRGLPWQETAGSGAGARTTVKEFDPSGNLRRIVNPKGIGADDKPAYTDTGASSGDNLRDATKNASVRLYTADDLLSEEFFPWGDRDALDQRRFTQKWTRDPTMKRVQTHTAPYEVGASSAPQRSYTYLANDWVASASDEEVHNPAPPNPPIGKEETSYDYDGAGNQVLWKTEHADSGPKGRKVTRSFYPSGLLKTRKAQKVTETDGEDTLTTRSYSHFYNQNRSLIRMDDTNPARPVDQRTRTTTFSRDAAEREEIVNETWGLGKDTRFEYDVAGNATRRQTDGRWDASNSAYIDSAGGRDDAKTTDFTYDRLEREKTMRTSQGSDPTRGVDRDYWPSGELQLKTVLKPGLDNNIAETRFYTDRGEVAKIRRQRVGDPGFQKDQGYSYDTNGNRTEDERGAHEFNARDQLVKWTRPGDHKVVAKRDSVVSYDLTANGALDKKTDTALPGSGADDEVDYRYTLNDQGSRLDQVEDKDTTQTYGYDDLGSVVRIQTTLNDDNTVLPPVNNLPSDLPPACAGQLSGANSKTTLYCFDEFERMVTARGPGLDKETAVYDYDGFDRRDSKIERVAAGTDKRRDYAYVGSSRSLSRETNHDGKTLYYDYSSTGEREGQSKAPAGQTEPTVYRSYAKDANGSVEGIEEENGTVPDENEYVYDPYGDRDDLSTGQDGDDGLSDVAKDNPFRFEGFYLDSGVKTYDMQARQYRPDTGRFLTQDRYEAAGADLNVQADPLTQNRYAFAGGNPISNIEFDGHRVCNSGHDCGGSNAEAGKRNTEHRQGGPLTGQQRVNHRQSVQQGRATYPSSSATSGQAARQVARVVVTLARHSSPSLVDLASSARLFGGAGPELKPRSDLQSQGNIGDRLAGDACGLTGLSCLLPIGDRNSSQYEEGRGAMEILSAPLFPLRSGGKKLGEGIFAKLATKGAESALSQRGKRRLAKQLGDVPRSASPAAQGGSARTGRWWEYDDVNRRRKIVVEHPDGTVHVGTPKPQSTHATGGPPKYYDYGNFGHVGE